MHEYRGAGGLLSLPGEPAPNGPDGRSVAAADYDDFDPLIRVLGKVLYEGWRDEAGEQRRFIAMQRNRWEDMHPGDRVLFCRMAERLLSFMPKDDRRRITLEAYVGT
jgi:hypothetical protein